MINEERPKLNNIVVNPWIRDGFYSEEPRILVLGHSTYIDSQNIEIRKNCPDVIKWLDNNQPNDSVPNDVLKWLISDTSKAATGDFPSPYWRRIMQTVTGTPDLENFSEFWDSIALYNFIQRIQEPGRHQADKNDYENGYRLIKKMISEMKTLPSHIICYSASVYDFLESKSAGVGIPILRVYHASWPWCSIKNFSGNIDYFLEGTGEKNNRYRESKFSL